VYQSFEVSNFRCFRKLNLAQLERVNLIAGVNNVGKTALLEALFPGILRDVEANPRQEEASDGPADHLGINTAYIERLNATFRSALAPLVRRGRALAHKEAVLTAGVYLVGCAYNFCWSHESLRLATPEGASPKWQERTPAMAAGLTDHRWTMVELLGYQVPLPAWVAPKRRGRPPKPVQQPAMAVAA
jgi:hypothetical protein